MRSRWFAAVLALSLFLPGCSGGMMETYYEKSDGKIEKAIDNGLKYLADSQLESGAFPTWITKAPELDGDGFYVKSVHITSFIEYSLQFVKSGTSEKIRHSAMSFIMDEMVEPGIWSFYSASSEELVRDGATNCAVSFTITPDLDCTAVASFALLRNRILRDTSFNEAVFYKNMNEQGLFYTWLHDYEENHPAYGDVRHFSVDWNDICAGTNSNILLYLGGNDHTARLSSYLLGLVSGGDSVVDSPYYHSELVFYYLYSRAYFNGASSLAEGRDIIVAAILSEQQSDGSFGNPMETALAVCTLLNLGYWREAVDKGINAILARQGADGSWPKAAFFTSPDGYYYGSAELTTALCLEALSRYAILMRG